MKEGRYCEQWTEGVLQDDGSKQEKQLITIKAKRNVLRQLSYRDLWSHTRTTNGWPTKSTDAV